MLCFLVIIMLFLLFNRFAHSAGPGREPQRVEAVWRAVDGLMHRSKWQSRSGIWEKSNSERRGKREERREKRDGSVPEGRDGREKGRALGETREERKEKREERDNHNQDERAEEGNSLVPEWCRKGSRLLGAEPMA